MRRIGPRAPQRVIAGEPVPRVADSDQRRRARRRKHSLRLRLLLANPQTENPATANLLCLKATLGARPLCSRQGRRCAAAFADRSGDRRALAVSPRLVSKLRWWRPSSGDKHLGTAFLRGEGLLRGRPSSVAGHRLEAGPPSFDSGAPRARPTPHNLPSRDDRNDVLEPSNRPQARLEPRAT